MGKGFLPALCLVSPAHSMPTYTTQFPSRKEREREELKVHEAPEVERTSRELYIDLRCTEIEGWIEEERRGKTRGVLRGERLWSEKESKEAELMWYEISNSGKSKGKGEDRTE